MTSLATVTFFAFFGVVVANNNTDISRLNNDLPIDEANTTSSHTNISLLIDNLTATTNNNSPLNTTTDHTNQTDDGINHMLDDIEQNLLKLSPPSRKSDLVRRVQIIDNRLRNIEKIVSYTMRLSPDEVKRVVVDANDFEHFPALPDLEQQSER